MKINEIKKSTKNNIWVPSSPFWPILLSDLIMVAFSRCSFMISYSVDKLHLVCLLIVIFLFKSCGFWIWFLLSFILRIIKKEQHISEYKSTSISSMGLKGSADICKKQFIMKIKSFTLFKITYLHNYYKSPLSKQHKQSNRFINCMCAV